MPLKELKETSVGWRWKTVVFPTYTPRLHAYRLSLMLRREDPCGCCPAAQGFSLDNDPKLPWSSTNHPCEVCAGFLGIPLKITGYGRFLTIRAIRPSGRECLPCPCHYFGRALALEKTKERLREFYQEEKQNV